MHANSVQLTLPPWRAGDISHLLQVARLNVNSDEIATGSLISSKLFFSEL